METACHTGIWEFSLSNLDTIIFTINISGEILVFPTIYVFFVASISTVLYQNYNSILYGANSFDGHGILKNFTVRNKAKTISLSIYSKRCLRTCLMSIHLRVLISVVCSFRQKFHPDILWEELPAMYNVRKFCSTNR